MSSISGTKIPSCCSDPTSHEPYGVITELNTRSPEGPHQRAEADTDVKYQSQNSNSEQQGLTCKVMDVVNFIIPAPPNTRNLTGTRHGSSKVCAASTLYVQEGLSTVALGDTYDSSIVAATLVNSDPYCDMSYQEVGKMKNTTGEEVKVSSSVHEDYSAMFLFTQ